MIIAVAGPRDPLPGTDDWVRYWVDGLQTDVKLVCGGAEGVDTLVKKLAEARGIDVEVIRPDYKSFPPYLAPLVRNAEIVSRCEYVYGFWHGQPKGGTLNTLWLNHVLLKAKPDWCLIDPKVNNITANAAFKQVCDNPPAHWLEALRLWKQSVIAKG